MSDKVQTWLWGIAALAAAVVYALSMLHAEAVTESRLKTMPSVSWGSVTGPANGQTPSI